MCLYHKRRGRLVVPRHLTEYQNGSQRLLPEVAGKITACESELERPQPTRGEEKWEDVKNLVIPGNISFDTMSLGQPHLKGRDINLSFWRESESLALFVIPCFSCAPVDRFGLVPYLSNIWNYIWLIGRCVIAAYVTIYIWTTASAIINLPQLTMRKGARVAIASSNSGCSSCQIAESCKLLSSSFWVSHSQIAVCRATQWDSGVSVD